MRPKTNNELIQEYGEGKLTQREFVIIHFLMDKAREAAVADVSATIPQIRKEEYKRGFEEGKQEAAEGCSCGNDVVYLSYCMECLHDLEVKAEQRGAQAERERWKKAICATDTIDAPEGGVIGVKAYWVDLEKLKEQGVKI